MDILHIFKTLSSLNLFGPKSRCHVLCSGGGDSSGNTPVPPAKPLACHWELAFLLFLLVQGCDYYDSNDADPADKVNVSRALSQSEPAATPGKSGELNGGIFIDLASGYKYEKCTLAPNKAIAFVQISQCFPM